MDIDLALQGRLTADQDRTPDLGCLATVRDGPTWRSSGTAPHGRHGARLAADIRQNGTCSISVVAYDEDLAGRLRELLEGEPLLTERRMFGGLAFLIGGNMAIAASGQGGVLVRVDPAQSDKLVDTSNAEIAVMRGRPMTGWLRIASEHLRTKRQLAKWAGLGAAYARSLPLKSR